MTAPGHSLWIVARPKSIHVRNAPKATAGGQDGVRRDGRKASALIAKASDPLRWPHSTHLRRYSHHPPIVEHSTQSVPLGLAAGLMPSLSDFIEQLSENVRGHRRCLHASCCLAVSNARVTLPNFYNIAIRIANVAARLAVLGLRLRDELGSSTSPKFITRLNICNADIHKASD